MPEYLTLNDGHEMRLLSLEEDAAVTAAALRDPDCPPMSEEQLEHVEKVGFQFRERHSVMASLYMLLDSESVSVFRKSGDGWEARVSRALQDWLRTHSPMDA
jgi:uncharacterized protein (DUF4415 family)